VTFPASAPPLPDVRRALAVFAHPDDVDFSSAGTVSCWIRQGIEVGYLIVTRGDAGGFDDTPRHEMPTLREREQRAAAEAVGVEQVDFLDGYGDGTLTATLALRRDIAAALRRFRPDRVLTSSPVRRWERLTGPAHPDHVVDITDEWPRKIAALRAHPSQTAHLDLETTLRDRFATVARHGGLPAGRLAEAFTVLRTE
jgi:LmbE family N-acetylglucosaminyl deacetylase